MMWNDNRIPNAIIKNILTSLLLLLIVFLAENRSYFFTYLPYKFAYEQREAYIQYGRLRYSNARVAVMEQDEVIAKDTVKRAYNEGTFSKITVGYAPNRNPSVVRTSPIVTSGQISVLAALILGNLIFIWRLRRAGG